MQRVLTMTVPALTVAVAVLLASCGASDQSVATASAANPLAEAVNRALADCNDPLHDSDGSGGFFEFCARADEARIAGRLDCLAPVTEPDEPDGCQRWRVDISDIPPYYFDQPPAVIEVSPDATEAPPAQEEPASGDVSPALGDLDEPLTPVPPALGAPDETPRLLADQKILEWNQIGGCQQLGDYCARHSIYGDGRVVATRASGEVLSEGSVDLALVMAVVNNADIDVRALVASLPPGPCQMAVDGIDHEVWIGAADVRVNTCDADLSGDHPLIAAARTLGEAASAAAPVVWDT